MRSPVVPFSDEDTYPQERTTNAAVGRVQGPADAAVVAAASDGEAAAWTADFKQDFAWRQAMVLKMQQGGQVYSEEETALIAKGLALLDSFAARPGRLRLLKHSQTIEYARTKLDKKTGLLVGEAGATICASPQQIVAYQMHYDGKHRLSQLDPEVYVRHDVVEVKSLHHLVVSMETKRAPFDSRCFLQASLWRKVSDAPLVYVWVTVPIERHDKVPPAIEAHAVRAQQIRCLRLTRIASDEPTKMEYAFWLDLRGRFPRQLANSLVIPKSMSGVHPRP